MFTSFNLKTNLFLLALTVINTIALGNITTIKGHLSDRKGESVIGANIYLKDTYDGTTSDANGNFSFKTAENGEQLLMISVIGYHPVKRVVECMGNTIELTIEMKPTIDVLTAVTITAGAMEASDEKRSVVFKPLDIVTTAGALGSIVGALSTLPGTSTLGDDGRLFVRGGDARETAIFFDGLRVGNAYGTSTSGVPTRSRFNPILFKGTFFSTGGYSAEYGQALSSALVLNTNDMPVRNQTDFSIMTVGGGASHTHVWKDQSVTASLNYTDLAPYQLVVPQNFDWERAPQSLSGELLYRYKLKNGGIVKAFYSNQNSGFDIWQKLPAVEGRGTNLKIGNQYQFGNTSIKTRINDNWLINGGLSYSYNSDDLDIDTLEVNRITALFHTKLKATYLASDRFKLNLGGENIGHSYSERLEKERLERDYTESLSALFAEGDYYFNDRLILRAGVRGEHSQLLNKISLAPRLSLAYQFDQQSQVSLAFGNFYQAQSKEQQILFNQLENAIATHYLVNYQFSKKGYTLRAEAFYKDYSNLLSFEQGSAGTEGDGYAHGFDLFYRDTKTFKGWDYWITYSFIDSKRKYANYQTYVTPPFAPRHNGSVVAKKFVNKLKSQIGGSWSWNDGRTYDNPNVAGELESKTKAFSNLSLSWSYLPRPNLIFHFACTNILGTENIFGYRYASSPDVNGHFASLPIAQGAKRFFFIGMFLTLSKDKSANQLNNL